MFLGHFEHNIDEKGRLTIPARYRDQLNEGAYITLGFDSNLWVLPSPDFQMIYTLVDQINMADPNGRILKRLILSHAQQVDSDRMGRILIPQFLRESAQLDSSAYVVGVGRYFEIWSKDLWQQQLQKLHDPSLTNERVAMFNLSGS
ncbi:MAG TPA: division/cell wall cluster transcriptional repressor MraZ [Anaerolineaceae bacterium]|nr:division/cell wall cluster transcriptional repressor MraZ [Anaerolineaceae bacterium]HQL38081.1 division/cell wall cluster transcriptional repressor MraZ [Anaerolineaceae bacterium]